MSEPCPQPLSPCAAPRGPVPFEPGCDSALALLAELRAGRPTPRPLALAGARLVGADLSGLDLSLADLRAADLSRANLRGATLFTACLEDAVLFEADLSEAECTGANLARANLQSCVLRNTGLGKADLRMADLGQANLQGASLIGTNLRGASLRLAHLEDVRAEGADLRDCDLTRSVLRGAGLNSALVHGAVMDGANLQGATLADLRGFERARWIGTDIHAVDFTGAYLCRNYILDQNFLEEYRTRSRWNGLVYTIWRATSDCGRSATRWTFCTALLTLLFAWLYTFVGVDYGEHETLISPLYFSVVTATTLGYGDVLPTTVGGQILAMLQVILGYVMLGGLLTIFSKKMASRANP